MDKGEQNVIKDCMARFRPQKAACSDEIVSGYKTIADKLDALNASLDKIDDIIIKLYINGSIKTLDHLEQKWDGIENRKGALHDIRMERNRLLMEYERDRNARND